MLKNVARPPNPTRFPGERELDVNHRRRSHVLHRRYPSLSDDHQPPMFSVRVVAWVAIIAIILALVYRG